MGESSNFFFFPVRRCVASSCGNCRLIVCEALSLRLTAPRRVSGAESSTSASGTGSGGVSARPYDPVRDKDNKK